MSPRRSRPRSDTSSPRARLKLPTFYLDESVSQRFLAAALRARGVTVEIREGRYREGISDVDWLADVGRRRWVVITKDKMIRQRANELLVLKNAKVRAFVLASGEMTGPDQATLFARLVPKMHRWITEQPAPFVVRVDRSGAMELLSLEGKDWSA